MPRGSGQPNRAVAVAGRGESRAAAFSSGPALLKPQSFASHATYAADCLQTVGRDWGSGVGTWVARPMPVASGLRHFSRARVLKRVHGAGGEDYWSGFAVPVARERFCATIDPAAAGAAGHPTCRPHGGCEQSRAVTPRRWVPEVGTEAKPLYSAGKTALFGMESDWSRRGSNPLPSGCKPDALPTELRPRGSVPCAEMVHRGSPANS